MSLTQEKYKVLSGYLHVPGNVFGGPFPYVASMARELPDRSFTVKLDPRCKIPADVDLPIPDFKLPESELKVMAAMRHMFSALSEGKDVYIGCTAGLGRTGTIMASLVNVARPDVDPVDFVREYYNEHAVETHDQEVYARTFASRHPWFTSFIRWWYLNLNY